MLQHACNVLFGILLIGTAVTGNMVGSITPAFEWSIAVGGALVLIVALWGFLDEAVHLPGNSIEREM